MTSKLPLQLAIAGAKSWLKRHVGEAGYYVRLKQAANDNDLVHYTEDELNAYDARLYPVLNFLELKMLSGMIPRCLQLTMDLWASPTRRIDDLGYIGQIQEIGKSEQPGITMCVLTCTQVKQTESGIDAVTHHYTKSWGLPDAWLEQHYPGSLHRILVAQSLGLSDEEVAVACTMSNPSVLQVCLPQNLSLDMPA